MRGWRGTKTKVKQLFLLRFSPVVPLAGSAVPLTIAGADVNHPWSFDCNGEKPYNHMATILMLTIQY